MNNKSTKFLLGFLLATVIGLIFYLTFQSPEQTTSLSEWVRTHLFHLADNADPHEFRSGAHLPLYFIFGLVLTLFGKAMSWKPLPTIAFGFLVGLSDELIKIPLPTRHFEAGDILIDLLGILLAYGLVTLFDSFNKHPISN